jgi:hypothetical protein
VDSASRPIGGEADGDERSLISVSSWRSRRRSEWRVMPRARVLVVAVVVGLVAFSAGWLLASAAEPELPDPIVVEVPGNDAPMLSTTTPTGTPSPPMPSTTAAPSIVPPPTVGPSGPPDLGVGSDDDDTGSDDGEDVDTGSDEGGADDDG